MEKFKFKKSLGQNFICDEYIINSIVDSANIDKNTLVIEIGPGAGALSVKLAEKSKNLILYEIDNRLEKVLHNKLQSYNNYELIMKDVLLVSLMEDISKYNYEKIVVVANIPYYITTPIISKIINEIYPEQIVIMIQEEVADRISAKSGTRNYGYMSVIVQSKYYVSKILRVSKKHFTPVPKVDSAVISLNKRNDLMINDYDFFDRLVKNAFRFKRKNIKNNLSNYDLDKINAILVRYNLSITDRSEDIPLEAFVDLTNNIK